jgi:hypothetical protein
MIPKRASSNSGAARIRNAAFGSLLVLLSLFVLGCAAARKAYKLPPYEEFVTARAQATTQSLVEIYGRYSATASGKTFRSSFNLLLDPGKRGYLEILGPSKQLLYVVSINSEKITLLWAADQNYIEENSTPETLNAIAGLPLSPDDVLTLIAGTGLLFSEWQLKAPKPDGWELVRNSFDADLHMQENILQIAIKSPERPRLIVKYDDYQTIDNRSIPGTIRFEVPDRKLKLEWKIEKYLPRDQSPSPELFAVQLTDKAHRLSLKEIYKGKPLLLQ